MKLCKERVKRKSEFSFYSNLRGLLKKFYYVIDKLKASRTNEHLTSLDNYKNYLKIYYLPRSNSNKYKEFTYIFDKVKAPNINHMIVLVMFNYEKASDGS